VTRLWSDDMDVRSAVAFADLAQELHGAEDLDAVLERAVAFARTGLAGDCAGIVLWPGHGLDQRRAAGSDWRVAAADDLQLVAGDGPGTSPVGVDIAAVGDTTTDGQWPRWGPRIAAHFGLRSVLSVPMTTRHRPIGVLILYAARRDAFAPSD
jgi:GAF domain-containing protein